MSKRLPDGSVVSSFFDTKSMPTAKEATRSNKILEGQVIRVHYVDDASNKSKKYVEYDVVAREAYGQAVTYKNCRNATDMGGTNNFQELVLEANEFAFQGKLQSSNFPSNMNGTIVKLAFLENLDKPIIIGGRTHNRYQAARRADGVRFKKEFNGVQEEINKDGEWTRSHVGPREANGDLKREDTGPTSFKVDKSGDYEFKQEKSGELLNSEKWERESKKKTTTVGSLGEVYDGDGDKKTFNTEGGLTVEYDGSSDTVTYTTSGGAVVTINGGGDITLDFNGTLIKIASGKIELTGAAVDVGEAASALAALGPQLVSWLTSHTHLYNPGPGGPTPSQPPTVPPPASLLSTSVKLKA